MKLVKHLANLGYGSRKEVMAMLRNGRFTDAGGTEIDADADIAHGEIRFDGAPLDPDASAVIMLNKPVGFTCSTKDPGRIVYDILPMRWRFRKPPISPIGRLDRDTSGLLVFARNADVQRKLNKQFENREVSKQYVALVYGYPADMQGEVNAPLRYDPEHPPLHIVDPVAGQPALTRWRVLERLSGLTRVLLEPVTGRSHQLRVHMQAIGHPIVGDTLYAREFHPENESRLCLHAQTLEFLHPLTGRPVTCTWPAPF